MIVRTEPNGELLMIGQTEHSKLVGQFGAHWGNAEFAPPRPFESVARAATFHDFGWLRYETAPAFDPQTGTTPGFRELPTDDRKLAEYRWCFEWFLAGDPYAALLVSMHRTGLWRGRYDAVAHPPHAMRRLSPAIDAFVAEEEARRPGEIAAHGWDPAEIRINYRLLQVWDLLGLYFSCQEPYDTEIDPIPRGYDEREHDGARLTLRPLGGRTVKVEPYPFDVPGLRVQLACRRLPAARFSDEQAFREAYFRAPTELECFELV